MAVDTERLLVVLILSAIRAAGVTLQSGLATASIPVTELCPYSVFCNQKASRRLDDSDLQPCCQPCSCSPDCASIENCCPDAVDVSMPTHVYPCRTQPEIYSEYLNTNNSDYIVTNLYRVVNRCPQESLLNPDLAETVAHCYNAYEIEDLVFVTGSTSRLTYLNRHCAICNNDTDHVAWTLYLVQNYVSTGKSFEDRDKNILTYGGVVSVPPSHNVAMPAVCNHHVYTRCNESTLWDFYDEEIDRKCTSLVLQSEFIDYTGPAVMFEAYANVYCFICNNPRGTVIPSVCKDISINPLDNRGSFDVPFSALVVLRQSEEDPSLECTTGEWFDPFRQNCTILLCPDGSYARNGECVRLFEDVEGYQMSVYMAIDILSGQEIATEDTKNIFNSMSKFVLNSFNVGSHRCKVCYIELTTLKLDSMVMRAGLFSTASCSMDYMLQGFARLFPSPSVEVHLKGENAQLLQLNVTNIGPISFSHIIEFRHYIPCIEYNIFLVNETITCPSIELGQDELHSFDDHAPVASMIAAQSRHVGDGTLRICIEDYVAILKANGVISGTDRMNCPLTLICMSILCSLCGLW